MLQPKRTKFRKQMKGRNRGLAQRGSTVSFGEFGLKATGRGRITSRSLNLPRRDASTTVVEFVRISPRPLAPDETLTSSATRSASHLCLSVSICG